MITIGWAIFLVIVILIFLAVAILLLNSEPTNETEYGYGPRWILDIQKGGSFFIGKCEPNIVNGQWEYENPNNADVHFVNVKKGGLFGTTYQYKFDPKDISRHDGMQGRMILSGLKHIIMQKDEEYRFLKDRNEYLENLISSLGVDLADLTMKQDQLEQKRAEEAKKRVIMPNFIKPTKSRQQGGQS